MFCLYQMLHSYNSLMRHPIGCELLWVLMICCGRHAGCQKMLPGSMELRLWMPLSTSMEEKLCTEI